MTHHRNTHSTRRPGRGGQILQIGQPGPAPDPEAAARAAFEAGEAALRAGQTLNAGRWLRLSRSLLALGRDIEALARQKAAAKPLFTPGISPEDNADENACEADVMAIVLAREAGLPEPAPRYEERAGLWDEVAFQRGELDLNELDLDAWLPPAWHSS
jgi:hypothetical protein